MRKFAWPIHPDFAPLLLNWVAAEAQKGHPLAQYELAWFFLNGWGVKKSGPLFIYWMQRSANGGYLPAANELGISFVRGQGVRRNFERAKQWYLFAARGNSRDAFYNLALLYDNPAAPFRSTRLSVKWMLRAAEHGDHDAQWSYGCRLLDGEGLKKSYAKSLLYFRRAAPHVTDAMVKIAHQYYEGLGVKRNAQKAFQWDLKAAKNGSAAGMLNVARALELGVGTPRNVERAIEWYSRALAAGNRLAKRALLRLLLKKRSSSLCKV